MYLIKAPILSYLPFYSKLKGKLKREQFEKQEKARTRSAKAKRSQYYWGEREEKIEREHESSCQFEFRFSKITCFLYHLLTLLPASSSMSSRSRKTWKKPCVNTKKLLVTPFKSDQDHSWLANRHHLLSKKTSSPKSQCSEFIPKCPKKYIQ